MYMQRKQKKSIKTNMGYGIREFDGEFVLLFY